MSIFLATPFCKGVITSQRKTFCSNLLLQVFSQTIRLSKNGLETDPPWEIHNNERVISAFFSFHHIDMHTAFTFPVLPFNGILSLPYFPYIVFAWYIITVFGLFPGFVSCLQHAFIVHPRSSVPNTSLQTPEFCFKSLLALLILTPDTHLLPGHWERNNQWEKLDTSIIKRRLNSFSFRSVEWVSASW